jgi:hypothetical protein
MELSAQAQWRYAQLYRTELNEDVGSDLVNAMLERRSPMLLRMAMIFALTDLQLRIDIGHIEAAMAWMRFATVSVKYVFVSSSEEAKMLQTMERSERLLSFLQARGQATRSQISSECFRGREPKARIDASLDHLLAATPPKISVESILRTPNAPGAPTRVYRLT